jgi:hypothetical protein
VDGQEGSLAWLSLSLIQATSSFTTATSSASLSTLESSR